MMLKFKMTKGSITHNGKIIVLVKSTEVERFAHLLITKNIRLFGSSTNKTLWSLIQLFASYNELQFLIYRTTNGSLITYSTDGFPVIPMMPLVDLERILEDID